MTSTRTARLAALFVGVVLAITACGGDSDDDNAASNAPATSTSVATGTSTSSATTTSASSATTSSAAASSAAAAADGDCDEEAVLSVKAALASAGDTVKAVDLIGGCGISIKTNLASDADGGEVAKALCTTAGAEAYPKGVASVSVDAADGKELAIGIKGAPCTGSLG